MKNNKLFRLLSLIIGTIMIMATLPMVTVGAADDFTYEVKKVNVALNKSVIAGKHDRTDAYKLVNGTYTEEILPGTYTSGGTITLPDNTTVSAATAQENDWFIIDLGRRYNISEVKIWPRYWSYNKVNLQYFNIEAANTVSATTWDIFGSFGSSAPSSKTTVSVNGNGGSYRYVRLRKTSSSYFGYAEIEVFADVPINSSGTEVVLPKVIDAAIESDTQVNVSFNEKMDIESLNAEGAVTLTTDDGTSYTPQSITLTDASTWDGGYDAVLTFSDALPSEVLTLNIDAAVKTTDETTFTLDSQTYVAGKTVAINKNYSAVRKNVNVAFGKTVVAGNPNHSSETAAKMVNGSYSDVIHAASDDSSGGYVQEKVTLPSGVMIDSATHQQNDWFIIDLGKRYDISEVKVWARRDVYYTIFMQYFDIEASNTEDFASYVTFGGVRSNAPTDSSTPVVINGDGNAYRYIRLRRTGNSAYGYCEIEVFADVMATEVSRGATAEATVTGSGYSPSAAFDGTISGYTGWANESSNKPVPNNLIVDLGVEYPLDMIHIYARPGFSEVYGANLKGYGYSTAAGKPSVSGTPANPTATLFGTVGVGDGKILSFKEGSFQYLVISKTEAEVVWLTEVRALVTNPEVNKVTVNDNSTITVSFSDKIDPAALVASNFTIDGVTLSNPTFATGWDGYYDVTFNYSGEIVTGMTLTVDESVKNQNGIEMAADAVIVLEKDTFTVTCGGVTVEELTANASHSVTAKIASPEGTDAVLYVAVKLTDGTFVSCAKSEATTIAAGDTAEITVEGITPKLGEVIYIYLWEDETLIPIVEDLLVK